MYYLVYKITNKIDKKIYIGCHKTKNIDDGYMGSGTYLKRAIKKYGLENFEKIILYNFDNNLDMLKKEAELVNRDFIKRKDVYNIVEGGKCNTTGFVCAKDDVGNKYFISIDDDRYLSGKLKGINSGFAIARDSQNKIYRISIEDIKYISGEYINNTTGYTVLKDKFGNTIRTTTSDIRYISGELVGVTTGFVTVKDKYDNYYNVSIDDPRIKTGELVGTFNGLKHTDKSKVKIGQANKIKQKGEGNSQYGTMWIHNIETKENKKIKSIDLNNWIEQGWIKGRKLKINNI